MQGRVGEVMEGPVEELWPLHADSEGQYKYGAKKKQVLSGEVGGGGVEEVLDCQQYYLIYSNII